MTAADLKLAAQEAQTRAREANEAVTDIRRMLGAAMARATAAEAAARAALTAAARAAQ